MTIIIVKWMRWSQSPYRPTSIWNDGPVSRHSGDSARRPINKNPLSLRLQSNNLLFQRCLPLSFVRPFVISVRIPEDRIYGFLFHPSPRDRFPASYPRYPPRTLYKSSPCRTWDSPDVLAPLSPAYTLRINLKRKGRNIIIGISIS